MGDDIRIVPFTDEEKARLNEKVRRMKFSRPPPKLPPPRQLKQIECLSPGPETNLVEGNACDKRAVDDSGISSCDSEKESSPVDRRSPAEAYEQFSEFPCTAYVCDGCDWVPEEHEDSNGIYPVAQPSSHAFPSPSVGKCEEPDVIVDSTTGLSGTVSRDFNEEAVQVEQNEDPQTRLPIKVEVDEEKSEFDAGVTERRPERIDQYSPVVYSGHLETALRRDYGGLVEVVSPGEQQLGRHERPQYGRLLLTTSTSAASLRHIMESALESLTSYVRTGKVASPSIGRTVESAGAPPRKRPNAGDDPQEEVRSEEVEGVGRKRKRKRGRKSSDGDSDHHRRHHKAKRRRKIRRARTISIVSTTADDGRSPLKLLIRREDLAKPSKGFSVKQELPSPSTAGKSPSERAAEASLSMTTEKTLRSPLRIKIAPLRPPTSSGSTNGVASRNNIEGTRGLSSSRNRGGNDKDDDIEVVFEDIRKASTERPHLESKPTLEETSLSNRMCHMLSTPPVDTSDPLWFQRLQKEELTAMKYGFEDMTCARRRERSRVLSHCSPHQLQAVMIGQRQMNQPYAATTMPFHMFDNSASEMMFHPLTSMMQHGMSVVNPVNPISQNIMLPGFAPVERCPVAPTRSWTSSSSPRKSLEKVIERLKCPHEDIPRDPAPSTSGLTTSPNTGCQRMPHSCTTNSAAVCSSRCAHHEGASGFSNASTCGGNSICCEHRAAATPGGA